MIGQDTEFFVFDIDAKRYIPAYKIGVPKEKFKVGWGSYFFRDGYAVEFNTAPTTCRAGLWEGLSRAMRNFHTGTYASAWDGIGEWKALPHNLKLVTDPIAFVDLSEVNDWPKDLKQLGCNPTWNPYTEDRNQVSVDPLKLPFRTSGAHLHYSFQVNEEPAMSHLGLLAKYCDLAIGLPFTVIYGDDMEFQRRTIYGKAGEFRDQTYPTSGGKGFEYRVLSSRLYNHPGIFGLISGIFKYMIDNRKALYAAGWNKNLDAPLQKAINTGEGAKELLEEFSKVMKSFVKRDHDGMSGIGYIPKDWGSAIIKLGERRRNATDPLNAFQMWLGQTEAHWGWSEYNDHDSRRSSTISHRPLIKEEPWLL